jgi:hypothetical protein
MGRHKQNHSHQYHNCGISPFIGGFWVMALARFGKKTLTQKELAKLTMVNSLDEWRFTEWFHGQKLECGRFPADLASLGARRHPQIHCPAGMACPCSVCHAAPSARVLPMGYG